MIGKAWGWLTGSKGGEIATKALDLVDDAFHTDEEKAEGRKGVREWFIKYLEATKPQNISRRIIVVQVTGLWTLLVIVMAVSGYFDRGEGSYSSFIYDVLVDIVMTPFSIILGFYFLKHVTANMGGEKK